MAAPLEHTAEGTGEGMSTEEEIDYTALLVRSLREQKLMYITHIIMKEEQETLIDLMEYSRKNLCELLDEIHNNENNDYKIKVSHRNKFAKIVSQIGIRKNQSSLTTPTSSNVKLLFVGPKEEEAVQSIESGQQFIKENLLKMKKLYYNLDNNDKAIKQYLDKVCHSLKQQIDLKHNQMVSSINIIYQYHLNELNKRNEATKHSDKVVEKFHNDYQSYFTDNMLSKADRKDKLVTAQTCVDVEVRRIHKYQDIVYNMNIILNKDILNQFFNQYLHLENTNVDLPIIERPSVHGTTVKWHTMHLNHDSIRLFQSKQLSITYVILYCRAHNEVKINGNEWNSIKAVSIRGNDKAIYRYESYDMAQYAPCKVKIQYIINNIIPSPESKVVTVSLPQKAQQNDDEKQNVMKYDPVVTRINSRGYQARLGVSGKYYCGKQVRVRCDCCDGRCGTTDGCNCCSCMALDVKYRMLPKGYLVNKKGFSSRLSIETGKFYCGRKMELKHFHHDGYCGPTNGVNCHACQKLDKFANRMYAPLLKK